MRALRVCSPAHAWVVCSDEGGGVLGICSGEWWRALVSCSQSRQQMVCEGQRGKAEGGQALGQGCGRGAVGGRGHVGHNEVGELCEGSHIGERLVHDALLGRLRAACGGSPL